MYEVFYQVGCLTIAHSRIFIAANKVGTLEWPQAGCDVVCSLAEHCSTVYYSAVVQAGSL